MLERICQRAVIAGLAVLPIVVAQAQAPPIDLGACRAQLRGYASWTPQDERASPWHVNLRPGLPGAVRVFGAVHSRRPDDPQFAAIDSAWVATQPTVVFYEGPARPVADSREQTIRDFGESGYVRFLAAKHGARIARLEPSPQAELDTLLAVFPAEQVKLFYVLREAARVRDLGSDRAGVDSAIANLLARVTERLRGLDGTFSRLDELAAAYARHFTTPADWHDVPRRWFNPIEDGRETGGLFTNAINQLSSQYRDLHMATAIVAEARAGERVFAVVGRNHVPMIAKAIACAMEKQ